MIHRIFLRRAPAVLWLAALALAFAALSPTLNAWRAQGQPKLFAELCTSMGFVRVAVDDSGTPAPSSAHAPECAWCLSPASWLAMAGDVSLPLPATIGREAAPVLALRPISLFRHHAVAWAQAPPVFS